jgi:unsaturated chondroitin disaccharide hydrolase
MHLHTRREPRDLLTKIDRLFALSAKKIRSIEGTWRPGQGAPVFTVQGRYRARGWTEWTQGFQFGSALLQFDADGGEEFLELGRSRTVERMAPHLTHMGVHDHGFNNVSTYGNLWRLTRERRYAAGDWEQRCYELALKVSGAVQARRWTRLPGGGFIHSFNGPHSLFVDTIRSLRSLALGHLLGQPLMEEQDEQVSLLERLVQHARTTAQYSVYDGRGRDRFDVRGRTAHESLFNIVNGTYRGPSTQQGYSPFTTWTRGLAWAMLGFAEQLEFLDVVPEVDFERCGGRDEVHSLMLNAARATCDHYIDIAAADGVPYWDAGAPGLAALDGWRERAADPFNDHEPVDSSAAAIAAQGLLRLARVMRRLADRERGTQRAQSSQSESFAAFAGLALNMNEADRYEQAGLQVLETLLGEPYLSVEEDHQGLLLHSVYHWPNGWDYVPAGARTPRGESSQWGDYHAREAALYVKRLAEGKPYLTFFGPDAGSLVAQASRPPDDHA